MNVQGLPFPTNKQDGTCFTDAVVIPTHGENVCSSLQWISITKGNLKMASKEYYEAVIRSKSKIIRDKDLEIRGLREINNIYSNLLLMLLEEAGGGVRLVNSDFGSISHKYRLVFDRDGEYYTLNLVPRRHIGCCVEN